MPYEESRFIKKKNSYNWFLYTPAVLSLKNGYWYGCGGVSVKKKKLSPLHGKRLYLAPVVHTCAHTSMRINFSPERIATTYYNTSTNL